MPPFFFLKKPLYYSKITFHCQGIFIPLTLKRSLLVLVHIFSAKNVMEGELLIIYYDASLEILMVFLNVNKREI